MPIRTAPPPRARTSRVEDQAFLRHLRARQRAVERSSGVFTARKAALRDRLTSPFSAATTLAAFVPLLFWPGLIGEFMVYLPITLLITLAASLVMALLFVPTVGALLGKEKTTASAALPNGGLVDID